MQDTIERKIFYYEIRFTLLKKAVNEKRSYKNIIEQIFSDCDSDSRSRFLKKRETDENKFGVYDYYKFPKEKEVVGLKLVKLRKDVFPQYFNDGLGSLDDIENAEEKSLVESTHVILDFRNTDYLSIAIEYNLHGPRISDVIYIFNKLGKDLELIRFLKTRTVVNNQLERTANLIGKLKFLEVKVMKENVQSVSKFDKKLGSMLEAVQSFSKSDYFIIKMRLDYEKYNDSNRTMIDRFIKLFTNTKESMDVFEKFRLDAEDLSKGEDVFEGFDLLMNKVRSDVKAARKKSSKVIISEKMYKLMLAEYVNKIA